MSRVNFVRRVLDKLLALIGRLLAWAAFENIQLRDRVRPGHWRDDNKREEGDDAK